MEPATRGFTKQPFSVHLPLEKYRIYAYSVTACYGFVWQGFGSRGALGVTSVRSCEKLPPCLIKPVPAGSKTDPPLAKAKPVSDGGSTSVIIYLRKGKKNCSETAVQREE